MAGKKAEIHIPVKLPWIFPGAPLKINGAPRNIQDNLTVMDTSGRTSGTGEATAGSRPEAPDLSRYPGYFQEISRVT